MAKMYYDKDADLGVLKGSKVAIIGYGSQGHAQAQNLRDSGVDVIVAELKGTPNYKIAIDHGFKPVSAAEASKKADMIQILAQDNLQAQLYKTEIKDNLKKGKTLVFSHGFNIHYGQILPPPDIDVIMVAPKGPGHLHGNLSVAQAFRHSLPSFRILRRRQRRRLSPMQKASVRRGQEFSRQPSPKRPKQTFSVNRPFSVGVHLS